MFIERPRIEDYTTAKPRHGTWHMTPTYLALIPVFFSSLLVLLNQKKARRVAINKPLILCAIRILAEEG